MRHALHLCLMAAAIAAVLWLAVGSADSGLYHHPLAVVGVGLIGLGLAKRERERRVARAGPDGR